MTVTFKKNDNNNATAHYKCHRYQTVKTCKAQVQL